MNSYAAWARVICYEQHSHTLTQTHLLLSYCQATIYYLTLKLPAWLWICRAWLPIPLSATQTYALMQENMKYYIWMSVFNQRSVMNVSLCLSWFLSLLSLGVFYYACVSLTLAGSRWGCFIWCSDVCRLGEIFHIPFGRHWPSILKAGTDSQVQGQPLTLTGLTLTQKHAYAVNCSKFYFTILCVCRSYFILEGHLYFPSLQAWL